MSDLDARIRAALDRALGDEVLRGLRASGYALP